MYVVEFRSFALVTWLNILINTSGKTADPHHPRHVDVGSKVSLLSPEVLDVEPLEAIQMRLDPVEEHWAFDPND